MIAWALSGGGNRGPVQVGAMRALFEHGIRPGMLLGTSAGALNAAFIAADPTPAGNERLAQMWLEAKAEDLFPKPKWRMLLRLLLGADGMDDNRARRNQFLKNMPPGIETFGDLRAKLYLTTADLQTARLYLYGDDPSAKLVDACLASTALPVTWDPELVNGHQFVDGAVVANVPISIAIDKGADEVYALDLQDPGPFPIKRGVIEIALHSISVQTFQQVLRDIEHALRYARVTLHYISLGDIFSGIDLRDFSHTAEMIELGYRRAKEYLAEPTPNVISRRVSAAGAEVTPPGAAPYHPLF